MFLRLQLIAFSTSSYMKVIRMLAGRALAGGVAAALVLQAMQPARGAGEVAAPIRSSGSQFFGGLKKLIVTDNTYRRSPGLAG